MARALRSGLPRRDVLLGASGAVALHALGAWVVLQQPPASQPKAPALLEISLLPAPAAPSLATEPAPPTPAVAAPEPPPDTAKPVPSQQRPAPAPRTPARRSTRKPPPAHPPEPPGEAPPTATPPATPSVTPSATRPAAPAADAATSPLTAPRFDAAYLNNPAPAYPPLSRRRGEQGRVLMRVFVDREGAPATIQLRESSGYRRLDEAAEAAIRRWRFEPARRGAEPVGAWVLVPIAFNLRS